MYSCHRNASAFWDFEYVVGEPPCCTEALTALCTTPGEVVGSRVTVRVKHPVSPLDHSAICVRLLTDCARAGAATSSTAAKARRVVRRERMRCVVATKGGG